jgi:hypothetical protein
MKWNPDELTSFTGTEVRAWWVSISPHDEVRSLSGVVERPHNCPVNVVEKWLPFGNNGREMEDPLVPTPSKAV